MSEGVSNTIDFDTARNAEQVARLAYANSLARGQSHVEARHAYATALQTAALQAVQPSNPSTEL